MWHLLILIRIDINECEDGTSNCDVNAACTDTEGSFLCVCNSGFSGDGFTCEVVVVDFMIEFEQPSFDVLEDIGLDNLALRVCINIFNLMEDRTITFFTTPGTAEGSM